MTFTELKERTCKTLEGEVTLSKVDFCLLGAVLLLAGICLGLLAAPFTHGISIGSHNGCNNGNNNGNNSGNANGDDSSYNEKGEIDQNDANALEDKAGKKCKKCK